MTSMNYYYSTFIYLIPFQPLRRPNSHKLQRGCTGSMGGATNLPPGFHFFPSDEDLVIHFLRRKAANLPCRPDIIPTVLLQHYNPWELNGLGSHPPTPLYFFMVNIVYL